MQIKFTHELSVGASKAPPTEFRLLKNGENRTTKGPINLTEASKAALVQKVVDDGRDQNRLSFDFNHLQVLGSDADAGKSAGWFSIEARQDGLWVVNAEWTKTAFDGISAREWRFFSPVLMLDPKTREPTQLINVALTNLPATKDQTPLVASQTAGDGQTPKESKLDETLVKLFGALGVSDAVGVEAKFVALSAEVTELKAAAGGLNSDIVALKADIAQRDEAAETAKRNALITALSADKKLTPAQKKWAQTLSTDQLVAYGEVAEVSSVAAERVEAPSGGETVVLSQDEIKLCEQMNLSQDDYLEARKAGL